jgi:tetratricopeptide (TPR) repeat protein
MTENTEPDLKALEEQGWTSLGEERYDDAISVFKKVFALDKTNIAAYQGTIAALRKKRDFSKAGELLNDALQAHPGHVGILSEQAWIYVARKMYAEAIDAFDKVLQISKADEGIFLWKISILRSQGCFDDARKTIEDAIKIFPTSLRIQTEHAWLLFHQKLYEESYDDFKKILEENPADPSSLQGEIASLRMMGRFEDAESVAKKATKICNNNPGTLSELGWLYFEQGQYNNAENAFQQALTLAPKDPYSHLNVAWALIRQGDNKDFDSAADLCREALRLDPDLSEAFGCLGVVAFKKDRLREAESYLLRSIQVDPKRGYYADLGALYIQVGRYDDAKDAIEKVLKMNPNDAYAHIQLGSLYLHVEEIKKATGEFHIAVMLEPYNPDAYKSLAIALIESGKLPEAETVVRKALIKLDRSLRWELHLVLCQILTRIGDETGDIQYFDEALEEARIAMRLKSDHAAPYFHSGVVRYKLEDYRNALKDFQQCKKFKTHLFESELNIKRIKYKLRQETAHVRANRFASTLLALVVIIQLIAIWYFRIWTNSISETMVTVLVPILLGLLVVALLLPWLTRLKVTGIEAELSTPQPKETLATGPKGDMGFSKISPGSENTQLE